MVTKNLSKRVKKLFFTFSILLNIAVLCFLIGKRIYFGNWGYFHPKESSQSKLYKYLKANDSLKSVVFIGTSITQGFAIHKESKINQFFIFGFAGATNEAIFTFSKSVIKKKPEKIFVEMGINNIRYKLDMQKTLNTAFNTINYLKNQSPNTLLFVQSVLPTTSDSLNAQILIYNKQVKEYCEKSQVKYIDLYSSFLRSGKLDSDLTIDGIHLSDAGYFLLRRSLETYIN